PSVVITLLLHDALPILEQVAGTAPGQPLLIEPLRRRLGELERARPPEPPRAYIWYEEGPKAPVTRILRRGNPDLPGRAVGPGLRSEEHTSELQSRFDLV